MRTLIERASDMLHSMSQDYDEEYNVICDIMVKMNKAYTDVDKMKLIRRCMGILAESKKVFQGIP